MKLTEMKTATESLQERLADNAELRRGWAASAFAREVAIQIVRYRTERSLTQRQLAQMTGVRQADISTLESGDVEPTMRKLKHISKATGLRFAIEVHDGEVELARVG